MFPSFRTVIERISHESFQSLVEYASEYDLVLSISPDSNSESEIGSSVVAHVPTITSGSSISHHQKVSSTSFSIFNGSLISQYKSSYTHQNQNQASSSSAVVNNPSVVSTEAYFARVDMTQLQDGQSLIPLRVFVRRAKTSHGLVYVMQDIYGGKLRDSNSTNAIYSELNFKQQQQEEEVSSEKQAENSENDRISIGIEMTRLVSTDDATTEQLLPRSDDNIDTNYQPDEDKPVTYKNTTLSRILEAGTRVPYQPVQVSTKEEEEVVVNGNGSVTCNSKSTTEHACASPLEAVEDASSVNPPDGIANTNANIDDTNSECIICLTALRTVAVYPCRHLSMCVSCASTLAANRNKCPLCRCPAELLLHLNFLTCAETIESNDKVLH